MKISVGISPSDTNRSGAAAFLGDAGVQTLTLTLNALAYSAAGSTIASRKNSDGNYYTVTFPDDFVHTTNSEDTLDVSDQTGVTVPRDPFVGLRSASAPYQIDTPLNITIEIPQGMSIGTNSHAVHVKTRDVFSAFLSFHDGFFPEYTRDGIRRRYNNLVNNNRQHCRDASADPCILIDFNTDKVTQQTIQNSIITIENSGNTLGGGGYGGMGGILQVAKGVNGLGGGGGGAGMGLHQSVSPGNFPTSPSEQSYYQFSNIATSTATSDSIPETPGDFLPLPGTGGLGYNYWPHTATDVGSSNYAANGGSSSIDSFGAGGAGQLNLTVAGRTYPALTLATHNFAQRVMDYSATHGGWGGNVVYFRSNVFSDSALSGTHINITNKSTGYMRGGCGGGGGGEDSDSTNGQGGRGGSWYDGGSYNTEQAAGYLSKGFDNGGTDLPFTPGLEGSLLFWNTSNVAFSNTFTNERSDGNWMQGRDARVT